MKEISRLRMKFICYNMLIVTAVIGITFCAVAFVMEKRVSAQGRLALAKVVSQEEHPLIFTTRSPAQTPYFSVMVGEDGMVTPWEGGYEAFPGQEFLEEMAFLGMAGEEDMGLLEGYHLRYLRVSRPTGYMIAFADTSYEDTLRNGVMQYGGLACAGIWIGFLVLSYFFSRWAVKPVEESIRMQKQFVADASHELKTPLTVILANTGLVLSHPEDTVAAQSKWLEYTHDEAEQMKGLVDDLLFLAKSDAARQPAARAETAISEVALGCLLPFESVAFESGVALEHRITLGLSLRGDEGQLRRLVMILLDNAVKYAGPGGTVTLTLERHQERLRLAVHNTGEPIPPEHLPHLFERFYRADAARNRSGGGYGLGLAIARSIVEGHHGRLTVTSTAAAGTTFTALLPRR